MTTPTPGDLSARLLNLLRSVSEKRTNKEAASECLGFIVQHGDAIYASLSALPAGGEPVEDLANRVEGIAAWMGHRFGTGCVEADHASLLWQIAKDMRRSLTTPPADADVGAQGDDVSITVTVKDGEWTGTLEEWRQRPRSVVYRGPAAVGAQGDGGWGFSYKQPWHAQEDAAPASREWRSRLVEMLDSFADEQGWLCFANGRRVGSRQCYTHVVFGEALSVSFDAPAAGKGVDDAAWLNEAVKLLCDLTGEDSPTDDVRMDHMCDVARRIAALTRQPVAGDGCQHEWVSGDNQYVHNTLICQRCYTIKPAAPTGPAQGDGEVAS